MHFLMPFGPMLILRKVNLLKVVSIIDQIFFRIISGGFRFFGWKKIPKDDFIPKLYKQNKISICAKQEVGLI